MGGQREVSFTTNHVFQRKFSRQTNKHAQQQHTHILSVMEYARPSIDQECAGACLPVYLYS